MSYVSPVTGHNNGTWTSQIASSRIWVDGESLQVVWPTSDININLLSFISFMIFVNKTKCHVLLSIFISLI